MKRHTIRSQDLLFTLQLIETDKLTRKCSKYSKKNITNLKKFLPSGVQQNFYINLTTVFLLNQESPLINQSMGLTDQNNIVLEKCSQKSRSAFLQHTAKILV